MAFPHPQSRKDHARKEDISSLGGVAWKFFKRTIDVTEYRNAEDDVNPAKDRPYGALVHDWLLHGFVIPSIHDSCAACGGQFGDSIPNSLAYSALSRCQPPNFTASG